MTASDFTNLHLQYKSAQADGEVPAVIEHDFPGGRMVDHYFVTPPLLSGLTRACKVSTVCPASCFCSSPTVRRGRYSSMSRA